MRKLLAFFRRPIPAAPAVLTEDEKALIRSFAAGAHDLAPQAKAIYERARTMNIAIGPELAFVQEVVSPVSDLLRRAALRRQLITAA